MKSTWFGTRRRYEFAKCLRDADYGLRMDEVFREFLQCSFSALYQPVHKLRHGNICPDEEATYMRSIGRVKHASKFSEAMAILVQGLEEDPSDFLGQVMSELDMNDSKFRGQCFTPRDLCTLMAQMQLERSEPNDERALWLNEPCCGGGAILIAASELLKGWGFYPWHYRWIAEDIDIKCFQMTFIQTTLLGIPAGVIHRNTLTLETWRSEWNLISIMHRARGNRGKEIAEDIKADEESDPVEITKTQLSLF